MKTPEEIMEALQKPFSPDEIEWMVKTVSKEKMKGLALPYVSNRAIQKRLDAVVGINNWKNEFIEWKDKDQLCGISIRFSGEWITKYDGAAAFLGGNGLKNMAVPPIPISTAQKVVYRAP